MDSRAPRWIRFGLVALLLSLIVGCQSGPRMFVLTSQRYDVSTKTPEVSPLFRFLRVESDGTAFIELTASRKELSAKPCEYFGPEEAPGTGLYLESSSATDQRAEIRRTWCEGH
jgi:hypothetical protein